MRIRMSNRWWLASAVSLSSGFSLRREGVCRLLAGTAQRLQMRGLGLTHDQQGSAAAFIRD